MGNLVGTPLYARQLAALEALQIYAPLGHGLGLRPLCAQLEDRCFQVCSCPAVLASTSSTLEHMRRVCRQHEFIPMTLMLINIVSRGLYVVLHSRCVRPPWEQVQLSACL